MLVIIVIFSFVTVSTVVLAAWYYSTKSHRDTQSRINRYTELSPTSTQNEATATLQKKTLSGWRAFVRRMSRHFEWSGQSRSLEHKLTQAGLPLRGSEFVVICVGVMVGFSLLLFMISGGWLIMASAGFPIGLFSMISVLRAKAAKRVRQFNDQLSDALVLVANSLRTGYSFLQSIEMVSREMPPPIGEEFSRVLKEMNLGITTEDALNNLAKRVDSDDLDLVITAVLIQRQVGGNLAEVLDGIAGTIRERIKLKGEVRSLTAQGRISGLIIGLLPFALGLMIYLVNPGYIMVLFTTTLGKIALGVALAGQTLGMLCIRKIVNIKY